MAAGLVSPPPLGAANAALSGDVPRTAPRITAPRIARPALAAPAPMGASRPPNLPVSSLSPVVVPEDAALQEASASPRRGWRWAVAGLGACAVAVGFLMARPGLQPNAANEPTHALGSAASEVAQPDEKPLQPVDTQTTAVVVQPQPTAAAGTEPATAQQPTAAPAAAEPAQAAAPEAAKPSPAPDSAATPEKPAHTYKVSPLMDQLTQRGGNLNPQLLAATFEKLQPQLEQCYAETLQKKPKLKGKLVLGFTVQKNGRATGFKHVGGNVKEPELIQCSVKAMEAARFPKPRKLAASVKLPFQFQPS
jgi:hypothetical protein